MANPKQNLPKKHNTMKMVEDIVALGKNAGREMAVKLESEIRSRMNTPKGQDQVEADLDTFVQVGYDFTINVKTGPWALMDAYGTGSLMMDESENSGLAEYMESDYWNPSRDKKAKAPITGRPAGNWDYFPGYNRTVKGYFDRINLEWLYEPIPPSDAIGEGWVELARVYDDILNEWLSKFNFDAYWE